MNKTTGSVYRIFLSSTAIDMVEHRKKVIDAILRMGDLPVAMETFGALPNEPVEVCKNKVRESNALVVMVAHRYGWVPGMDEGGDGVKSITRIEVDTAVEEGIPVLTGQTNPAIWNVSSGPISWPLRLPIVQVIFPRLLQRQPPA